MSLLELILSIPKSLYVSLRLMPLKYALKLPIFVRYNCKIISLKGKVEVDKSAIKTKILSIGFGSVGVFDKTYERSIT